MGGGGRRWLEVGGGGRRWEEVEEVVGGGRRRWEDVGGGGNRSQSVVRWRWSQGHRGRDATRPNPNSPTVTPM